MAAKEICRSRPVVAECEAAGRFEKHGTWGGHSAFERSRALSIRSAGRASVPLDDEAA